MAANSHASSSTKSAAILRAGTIIDERFELLSAIASGGMGTVYRAHDRQANRVCALKVLHADYSRDPRSRRRFAREATNAQQLSHPHIVRTFASGVEDDVLWLAMELIDAPTLDRHVRRTGPLTAHAAAHWIDQLAQALEFAHQMGIVHRDVKPSNILVRADVGADADRAHLMLVDFGIARIVDDPEQALTTVGTVIGTPAYMAPEQRSGRRTDARGDVFALAVVAAFILAGRLPMAAWAVPLTVEMFGPKRPWPASMDDVLARALAEVPSARTRSVRTFSEEFTRIVHRDASQWPIHVFTVAEAPDEVSISDLPTAPYQPLATTLPPAPAHNTG